MGIKGAQEYALFGGRVYFQRDDDTTKAYLDIGTIETPQLQMEVEKVELKDADGGVQVTVDEAVISINETYDIVTSNVSLQNLALLFLADQPEAFSQAATEQTAVAHKACVGTGKMIKLLNSSGDPIYDVASIVVKDAGGTPTHVENTDWKWISKPRGLIQIISGGGISDGDSLEIDITPNAITSSLRLVKPLTGGDAIPGKAIIVLSSGNNANQLIRECSCTLSPNGTTFQVEDFSNMTFSLTVTSDLTQTTPSGRLLKAIGSLPANP